MMGEQLLLSRRPKSWLLKVDEPAMECQALIVSPDLRLHNSTRAALKRRGIGGTFCKTSEAGLAAFREHDPEVVVVDLGLPGMSGFDLCQEVRRDSLAHLVVIAPPEASGEAEILLRLGADSFHSKPLAGRHLAALIGAALRRRRYSCGVEQRKPIRVGSLEVDLDAYEVRIRGRTVALTPTEFRLLGALAHNPGQVLTRPWLVDRIWDRDPVHERSVGSYISRLRKKLYATGECDVNIVAVPGRGYALFTQPQTQ
ncbi:MAG: response regulator transcription factor [Armatimonadota bacterium]